MNQDKFNKEAWKKWLTKDNLLILILSGVLLLVITLPSGNSTEGKKSSAENKTATQQSLITDTTQKKQTAAQKSSGQTQETASQTAIFREEYVTYMEQKLEELLTQMKGVGKVSVMITLSESEELVVEKDGPQSRTNLNESDASGGNRVTTQMDSDLVTVFSSRGDDSTPYVVKTLSPRIQGVVVVAQGADSGQVNQNITELVQALFDIESHKIKVVKMASSK